MLVMDVIHMPLDRRITVGHCRNTLSGYCRILSRILSDKPVGLTTVRTDWGGWFRPSGRVRGVTEVWHFLQYEIRESWRLQVQFGREVELDRND